MKNSNNRTAGRLFFRSYNLLVELAFICGCFIFSACVFVLVFVKAGQISARSEDLSAAVIAAQNLAESVLPENGEMPDGEQTREIYFDRNWNPIPQTGDVLPSHVHASAAVTETWNDGLVYIEVVITGSGGEEELFRLTADRDFS